ncbi:hypothetical protein THRCLA_10441 [Thraustotheca clavata]|uniref:Transmembrane protein n=1 Tax=Thraustotheca clavata TaxID=74557 RepID=A0A1V9YPI3_9STRA|nr:hypothetical protein THRCLA_10441 [Thraustotheca clavata]
MFTSCIESVSLECLVNEDLYLPLAQFVFIVIVATQMVLRFYSSRVKSVIFLLFIGQYVWKWYGTQESFQSSRKLLSIEPNFVFAEEPIFVLLDGENLNEGAHIGWVPYWSCAQHSSIINCPVVHASKLSQGGVSVTFTDVDEYIPCYYENIHEDAGDAQPTNIATHMYECFESQRLIVKHQKSQPGWSLHN